MKEKEYMRDVNSIKFKKINFINLLIVPSALCFLVFICAPLELLFTNRTELNYNMYELLGYMLPVMFLAAGLLSILLLLLRKKAIKLYRICLFLLILILVTLYIQGTFLAKKLPPLDGRTINWIEYGSQRWYSIAILVFVVAVLLFLWEKLDGARFELLSSVVAGLIILLLGVSLLFNCIMTEGYRRNKVIVHSDSYLLDMADGQDNMVILLMDAVDGETFQKILKEVHPEYSTIFEDFTSFKNVTSCYPYTSRSVPFILSGMWYENKEPFDEYCKRAFEESPLFLKLHTLGFRMGMYDPDFSLMTSLDGKFENISSESKIVYPFRFIQMQIKMAGYRFFPFDLKKFCYMTPEEIFLANVKSNGQEQYYSMDNTEFLKRLKEKKVVPSDTSCFRFIYIWGAHSPFVYPSQSEKIQDESYESSVELSIEIANEYLCKLKSSGVFDNTAIVILADHGYVDGNASFGRQNPVLMIKGLREKHPYAVSDAPVSHEDLQLAFSRLLDGKQSTEVFDWREGDKRERRFLFYEFRFEDHMEEYLQTGEASCEDTMVATGKEYNLK